MKDKKGVTITNAFEKSFQWTWTHTKEIWVKKGGEFCCRSVKSWSQDNNTEIYSAHNGGKSVITERFVKILKNKIYKYVTSISKNVYIDKLNDIFDEYNNTYHTTIKTKPV